MRTFAEWLVVPLVILPLLAAGGLFLWARDAHRRDLEPYRADGAAVARAWLTPPTGAAAQLPFDSRIRDQVDRAWSERGIPIAHPWGAAAIVVEEVALTRAPWTFSSAFPEGLEAEALADPAIRLQVESGRPPVELRAVGEAATTFQRLLHAPSLSVLRTSSLPCATKRFLVYRWLERDPANEEARAAARLLEIVRDYEGALDGLPSPLRPGAWPHGDLRLLVAPGSAGKTAVFAESPGRSPPPEPTLLLADGGEEAPVRLFWAFPDWHLPKDDVLWQGRLTAPFAGAYAFQAKHGLAWWQAPRVRRYAGPMLALLLASLLLPLALLGMLRRRRHLDEARVRFLNELAHDLRTPLTSLRLHAELLTGGKAKTEKKAVYAARMAVESARLSSLLGNLLDLSRLERGGRAYETERIVVADLLADARRDFAAVFPKRAGDLSFDGDPDVVAMADRSALARVLANLLENAGKFTDPGTRIHVRWAGDGGATTILVEDEGPGIPAEERSRVFGRYCRGARAKRDGVPGTGLGLALVRELVEGMGGTVSLRPAPGAAFEIRLGGGGA